MRVERLLVEGRRWVVGGLLRCRCKDGREGTMLLNIVLLMLRYVSKLRVMLRSKLDVHLSIVFKYLFLGLRLVRLVVVHFQKTLLFL